MRRQLRKSLSDGCVRFIDYSHAHRTHLDLVVSTLLSSGYLATCKQRAPLLQTTCMQQFLITRLSCWIIVHDTPRVLWNLFINPRRMRRRVTVLGLSFVLSTQLQRSATTSTSQLRYAQAKHDNGLQCDSWILQKCLRSRVMASSPWRPFWTSLTARTLIIGFLVTFHSSCSVAQLQDA